MRLRLRMTRRAARSAVAIAALGAAITTGVTACSDEITGAQESARAGVREVWAHTGENLRNVRLGYGTPDRDELLNEGLPPFAPAPGTDTEVYGSNPLALTTRLTRESHAFTVDLFLLSDGAAGSGDLSKQRSAYACIRVTVARRVYRLVPRPIPCRHDLLRVRDQQDFQRVHLDELRIVAPAGVIQDPGNHPALQALRQTLSGKLSRPAREAPALAS